MAEVARLLPIKVTDVEGLADVAITVKQRLRRLDVIAGKEAPAARRGAGIQARGERE